jgi:drug/metabolite transporter (DMT)-like permease
MMIGSFGEFSQAWTRGLILMIVVIVLNFKMKFLKKIEQKDKKWFLIIALAGGLNQAPYFYGFEHLTIGTATLLFYASLVVGGYVLGKIFFKEKMTLIKILSLVISIFGMGLIYGFALSPNQFFPASMTILSGIMGASAVILSKKLVGNYHELQIMLGYFFLQVVFNYPLALLFIDSIPALTLNLPWIGQLGYATAMMVANMSVITGFKYLDASIGSLIGLVEILFGALFGLIIFGESLGVGVVVGGICIILAAALPSLAELKNKG